MKKNTFRMLGMVWGAVMIAVISCAATMLISGQPGLSQTDQRRWVKQDEYDVLQRYRQLEQVRQTLVNEYYEDLDEDELVLGAIRGMTASVGDPYTFYYTEEELARAEEDAAGVYRGIGVLLQNNSDREIEVVRVFPGTPAEAAGMRDGDILVAVDGEPVNGFDGHSYAEAVRRVRGGEGEAVALTVLRDGQTLTLTVIRGEVQVSYASYQVIDGDIGYISIMQFSGDARQLFLEAIDSFRAQGVRGLVIDVRNNPGGLLDQVVDIADAVLPKGVIVYAKLKDGTRNSFYSDEAYYDVPLAVLVNDMSASASEILAGSVQALNRGVVVGETTYGKGVVQTLKPFLEGDGAIQLTTASYYDALDRCPQGKGVTPDVELPLEMSTVPLAPDLVSDNQLIEAVARVRAEMDGAGEALDAAA